MKILVAIKQVPVRDSALRVDSAGRWIDEADLSFEINEPDAYALEEALQLKEKLGGEVVALCAGPARAQRDHTRGSWPRARIRAILRRAARVSRSSTTLGMARLLASAALVPRIRISILTGLQSDDLGSGQTEVVLAGAVGLCRIPPSSCRWKYKARTFE